MKYVRVFSKTALAVNLREHARSLLAQVVCVLSRFWGAVQRLYLWPDGDCVKLLAGSSIFPIARLNPELIIPRLSAHRTAFQLQKGSSKRHTRVDAHVMYDRLYAAQISDQALRLVIARKLCAGPATKNSRAHSFVCCLRCGAQIQVYGQPGVLVNRSGRLSAKRVAEAFESLARHSLSRVAQGSLLELPHKGGGRFELVKMYTSPRPKIIDVVREMRCICVFCTPRVLKIARERIIEAHVVGRSREVNAFTQRCVMLPRWHQRW
jgi:hypothetical protein